MATTSVTYAQEFSLEGAFRLSDSRPWVQLASTAVTANDFRLVSDAWIAMQTERFAVEQYQETVVTYQRRGWIALVPEWLARVAAHWEQVQFWWSQVQNLLGEEQLGADEFRAYAQAGQQRAQQYVNWLKAVLLDYCARYGLPLPKQEGLS